MSDLIGKVIASPITPAVFIAYTGLMFFACGYNAAEGNTGLTILYGALAFVCFQSTRDIIEIIRKDAHLDGVLDGINSTLRWSHD